MTTTELHTLFNQEFGFNKWPETYEVSIETYGNVCNTIFQDKFDNNEFVEYSRELPGPTEYRTMVIAVGAHGGILFKNVELIVVK